MSGGSMDYVGFKIEEAASYVAGEIKRIEKMGKRQISDEFRPCDIYIKEHPDRPYFRTASGLRREALKRLRAAKETLEKAAVYAIRVEWLTSYDDGYDSFILRTDEELEKVKKRRKRREV